MQIQLHRFYCLHCSVFNSRSNGMWAWRFGRARWCATVRTKKQKRQKFFFIGALLGLLMVFSATMKAGIRSYKKCVSVLGVYTSVFHGSVFEVSTKVSVFKSLRFQARIHRIRVNERPKQRHLSPFLPEYVYV